MDEVIGIGIGTKKITQDFRLPVLSAMILDPGCAASVLRALGVYELEDVFDKDGLVVAEAIVGIVREGKLPSYALVLERLRAVGQLDKVISEEAVRGIATHLTAQSYLDASDVMDWVQVVIEDTDRRLTKRAIDSALKSLSAGSSAPEVRRELTGALISGGRIGEEKEGFKPIVSAVDGLAAAAEDWFIGKPHSRVPTGLADVDYMLGGGLPVGLTTIGGRPGMGKSTLLLAMATEIAQRGERVAFLSLEMSTEEIALRRVCSIAQLDSASLVSGRYANDAKAREKFENALVELGDMDALQIDDTPDLTTDEMLLRLVHLRAASGKFVAIFVDYIGLVERDSGRGVHESDSTENTYKRLRAIGRRFGVPVVVASQLNREVENRANRLPIADDLRYGGTATSDAILLVYYPYRYISQGAILTGLPEVVRDNVAVNDFYVIVGKGRTGVKLGRVRLRFVPEHHILTGLDYGPKRMVVGSGAHEKEDW